MAVVSVKEMPEAEEGWDQLWRRTYTRTYRVECDNRQDTSVVIRNALIGGAPWLPRIGAPFGIYGSTIDAGSFLNSVRYRRTRVGPNPEGSTWEVEMNWGPYDAGTFGTDPTAWPMRISFTSQKYERVIWIDVVSGAAIVNSAGDPFEDPITCDDTRSVITVTRNELCKYTAGPPATGYNPQLAETYRDSTNSATWNTFPLKQVKCSSITTGDPIYDSNNFVYYYEVVYVFEINRDTWVKKVRDQGYQYLDGSGKSVPVVQDGQQADDPVLLDGSGHVLSSGGTPVALPFDVYPPLDFSGLNISFASALGWS